MRIPPKWQIIFTFTGVNIIWQIICTLQWVQKVQVDSMRSKRKIIIHDSVVISLVWDDLLSGHWVLSIYIYDSWHWYYKGILARWALAANYGNHATHKRIGIESRIGARFMQLLPMTSELQSRAIKYIYATFGKSRLRPFSSHHALWD